MQETPNKAITGKYTISYHNKDVNKSNICQVIILQIRIGWYIYKHNPKNNRFEKKSLFCSEKYASKEELLQEKNIYPNKSLNSLCKHNHSKSDWHTDTK